MGVAELGGGYGGWVIVLGGGYGGWVFVLAGVGVLVGGNDGIAVSVGGRVALGTCAAVEVPVGVGVAMIPRSRVKATAIKPRQ